MFSDEDIARDALKAQPALLAEVERLRARVAELENAHRWRTVTQERPLPGQWCIVVPAVDPHRGVPQVVRLAVSIWVSPLGTVWWRERNDLWMPAPTLVQLRGGTPVLEGE